jgi:hypothetical protein
MLLNFPPSSSSDLHDQSDKHLTLLCTIYLFNFCVSPFSLRDFGQSIFRKTGQSCTWKAYFDQY